VVSVPEATGRFPYHAEINTNTSDCSVSNVMPIREKRNGKLRKEEIVPT
jgi:hypothetical protein